MLLSTFFGCRVGVVFSGRQSPGGHNVITGLYDALKAQNKSNILLGFVGKCRTPCCGFKLVSLDLIAILSIFMTTPKGVLPNFLIVTECPTMANLFSILHNLDKKAYRKDDRGSYLRFLVDMESPF
jgi:hypothetical protein